MKRYTGFRNLRVVKFLRREKKKDRPLDSNKFLDPDSRWSSDAREWLRGQRDQPERHQYSVIVPVFEPIIGELNAAVQSVEKQTFSEWEIVLVADGLTAANQVMQSDYLRPKISEILDAPSAPKSSGFTRGGVVLVVRDTPGGIRDATVTGISAATGTRTVFLDQDDVFHPLALECLDRADFDACYTDHVVVDVGLRVNDEFRKPAWSPFLAHQVLYFGHLKCFDTEILKAFYNYDLPNLVADHFCILGIGEEGYNVLHLPLALYGWRQSKNSVASAAINKPGLVMEFERGVAERSSYREIEFRAIGGFLSHKLSAIPRKVAHLPKLHIVVPTAWVGNHAISLALHLVSLGNENVTATFVDTKPGSRPLEMDAILKESDGRISICIDEKPFNFSRACNVGADQGSGGHLLFLNDDVLPLTYGWAEKLQGFLEAGSASFVGPQLVFPDGRLQHGGVALGLRGTADHMYHGWQNLAGPHGHLSWDREISAVTGAALLTKRQAFERVGGFDEGFEIHYQDVDLCLRLAATGSPGLQVQSVQFVHFESESRGEHYSYLDRAKLISRHNTLGTLDPYWVRGHNRATWPQLTL